MFVFWMCKIFCSLQLKPHKREYLQSLSLFLCYPLYALYLQTFCYFNFLAKKNNVWVFSFPPYFLHKREHPPNGFHGFFFSFYQWLLRIVNIQFIMIFFPFIIFWLTKSNFSRWHATVNNFSCTKEQNGRHTISGD